MHSRHYVKNVCYLVRKSKKEGKVAPLYLEHTTDRTGLISNLILWEESGYFDVVSLVLVGKEVVIV